MVGLENYQAYRMFCTCSWKTERHFRGCKQNINLVQIENELSMFFFFFYFEIHGVDGAY